MPFGDRRAASLIWGWVWKCQERGKQGAGQPEVRGRGYGLGPQCFSLLGRAVHVALPQHIPDVGLATGISAVRVAIFLETN